jgi:flagellar biosynthesis protein FliQ
VLSLIAELSRMALLLNLPLLSVILIVGLIVSVLQVGRRIQDPSMPWRVRRRASRTLAAIRTTTTAC